MKRNDWLKMSICAAILILVGLSATSGNWYPSMEWPWDGLFRIATAFGEAISPLVFIYFMILVAKQYGGR